MDLAKLLIDTGVLGLCGLLILELRDVRKAIADGSAATADAMIRLASIIHDHKARAGDTPPAIQQQTQRRG